MNKGFELTVIVVFCYLLSNYIVRLLRFEKFNENLLFINVKQTRKKRPVKGENHLINMYICDSLYQQ